MKTLYKENKTFKHWFNKVVALAHVPCEHVENVLESLLDEKEDFDNTSIDKFMDYFVENWIEGDYNIALWNHYENLGPRTNNYVERLTLHLLLH